MLKITPREIEKISAFWQISAPFLSEFLLRFTYIKDNNLPTMGVSFQNKALTLYYNENFLNSLSREELEGVLVHEIMHILYNHTLRFIGLGEQLKDTERAQMSHEVYNYAGDAVINEMIMEDLTINGRRLALPTNCISFNHQLLKDYDGTHVTESVYLYLYDKIPKVKLKVNIPGQKNNQDSQKGEGQQGGSREDGDNQGKQGKDKNEPGNQPNGDAGGDEEIEVTVFDIHNKLGDLNSHEAKEMVELIKYTAQIKGWGTMSGKGVDVIKELIRPKKIPIQKILRAALQSVADGYLLKYDTYSKSNRRGYNLLPGKKKKGATINIAVDTSGSCFSSENFGLFFGEVDYLSNRVKDINLIQVDTQVQDMRKYTKGFWKNIEMKGCGGTVFQPLFDFLVEKKLSKYPTIIFTDGEFDWNMNNYGIKPLWVLNNQKSVPDVTFGSVFCLEDSK